MNVGLRNSPVQISVAVCRQFHLAAWHILDVAAHLAFDPEILVADEAVSALDVSVQAQV